MENRVNFTCRKLPQEALASLRKVRVADCQPHVILLTPVYVYLLQNQKFIAVKEPLNFFEPADLEKFLPFENFYIPEFIDLIAPFQKAGRLVRDLLMTRQKFDAKTNKKKEQEKITVLVPVPQHELDDAIVRIVGPLWSKGVTVEPFFLYILMEEVCDALEQETLKKAIEKSADLFELALLRSSVAVFLALHLGYCERQLLKEIRNKIFNGTMDNSELSHDQDEISHLLRLVQASLPNLETRSISIERFLALLENPETNGRGSRKLISRLKRVNDGLIDPKAQAPSIFGKKGLIHE
jgi:hypothetical protein